MIGHEAEWGYFSLAELAAIKVPLKMRTNGGDVVTVGEIGIERDLYWTPTKFKDLKKGG